MALSGSRAVANAVIIKEDEVIKEWGEPLIKYNWCPSKKEKFGADADIGRTLCEDEGRDQGEVSIHQGALMIISRPPEAEEEAWDQSSLHSQKESTLLIPWSWTSGL